MIDEMEDRTPELAEALGLGADEFIDYFDGCWEQVGGPVPHDFDSDPSDGMGFEPTPWHVQGAPWQLMIRVFDHGVFLASPRPQYDRAVPAGLFPSGQTYLARWDFESERRTSSGTSSCAGVGASGGAPAAGRSTRRRTWTATAAGGAPRSSTEATDCVSGHV